MRIEWLTYFTRFLLIAAIQILFFNHINLFNVASPFFYVLFFLTLPIEFKGIPLLVTAFTGGLVIDVFSNTLGMHSTACLTLAFARPFILELFSPREGYEVNSKPTISEFGIAWFVPYAATLLFIHHLILFVVEALRFSEVFWLLGKTFASTIFTLIVVVLAQSLRSNSTQFE